MHAGLSQRSLNLVECNVIYIKRNDGQTTLKRDQNYYKVDSSFKVPMWIVARSRCNVCEYVLYYTTKCSEAITNPPACAKIYKDSWDFAFYVEELNSAISSEIFKHQSWIQFYYTWAGFKNYNLVVRVNILDNKKQEPLFFYGRPFWLLLCFNFVIAAAY